MVCVRKIEWLQAIDLARPRSCKRERVFCTPCIFAGAAGLRLGRKPSANFLSRPPWVYSASAKRKSRWGRVLSASTVTALRFSRPEMLCGRG